MDSFTEKHIVATHPCNKSKIYGMILHDAFPIEHTLKYLMMTYAKKTNFSKRFQRVSSLSRALSHPARLAILEYLAQQNQCISGDISDKIPLSRPTVSHHLQELKKAELIKGVLSGKNVYYCVDAENIKQMEKELHNFLWELAARSVPCEIDQH